MFVIETKNYSAGKRWQPLRSGMRYATEAEAWDAVASFDEDGYICRATYRVVPVK